MVDYSSYKLKSGELGGLGPRRKSADSVFVAYRFRSDASNAFRIRLEQELRRIPSLSKVAVTDGHVDAGDKWPTEIRRRLERCRVVVADLTELSPEVLFECGFAWGLGRRILPVTQSIAGRRKLPQWLSNIQAAHFSDEAGWASLVESISSQLKRAKRSRRLDRRDPPVPGLVVLLRSEAMTDDVASTATQLSARFDMPLEELDVSGTGFGATTHEITETAGRASLCLAMLGNVPGDSLANFVAGAIAAVPSAGAASHKLRRQVLLIVRTAGELDDLVAHGARHAHRSVILGTPSSVGHELLRYGERYEEWRRKQEA